MLGLLVITHGKLAEDLVEATRKIVGPIESIEAVSIAWNDDVTAATDRIAEAVSRVDRGKGVLLLTDMFGGTPTNLSVSMLEPGKVEIVTGVNLPMLIKFANLDESKSLLEAATIIAGQARDSIHVASELLQPGSGGREEGGA